ncbi:hypothetical protein [Salinibacterium sp. ZJ454]|uniref:hypothetical protein n=1 Tax=Salinibacterium sp. ZJ454 TaxID=2708339 RepID=UPI001FB95BD1|nr:hypothetical protein [Salinibacterium sp. ZJ454]
MNENGEFPDGSFVHLAPVKPLYIPLDDVRSHALLRLAEISGDSIEWPGLNTEQQRSVSGIRIVHHSGRPEVSIPPRVNWDYFVDAETDESQPAPTLTRLQDMQRFYTRFSDSRFLHIGTYTAITIDGVRRYFTWRAGAWEQIDLSMFLYVRDHDETHFAESSRVEIEEVEPGTARVKPVFVEEVDLPDTAVGNDDEDEELLMSEVDAMVQHGIAVGIASIAHRGQTDKLGYSYIDHPARVAAAFDWLDEPVAHCAAWLHDVLEDTDVTAQDLLNAGILPEIVDVVELLTRRAETADEIYYNRIRLHPIARSVKLADIADNTAEWRTRRLDYDTQVRLSQKYYYARKQLGDDE